MNKNSVVAVILMAALTGCSQNSPTPPATPAADVAAETAIIPENITAAATATTEAAQAATTQVQGAVQSAADAIKQSVNQGAVQQQIDYLVAQAKKFIGEEKYEQVTEIANHILTNLDQNSAQAKDLLQTAQAQLQEKAKAIAGDVQNSLGSFMKK